MLKLMGVREVTEAEFPQEGTRGGTYDELEALLGRMQVGQRIAFSVPEGEKGAQKVRSFISRWSKPRGKTFKTTWRMGQQGAADIYVHFRGQEEPLNVQEQASSQGLRVSGQPSAR
jgi:cold shock CspA family protein